MGLLLTSILSIILIGVGATSAYIAFKTQEISNEFIPAHVACKVEEDFSDGVKSNVCIKNTGDISAYIRAALVINWVNDTTGAISSEVPQENVDYTIVFGDRGWYKGNDGYYYFDTPIVSGSMTLPLITRAAAISENEGYSLSIHILANAIQSDPPHAAEESWNVTITNGLLDPT